MIVREGMLRDAPHISTWSGKRVQLLAPDAAQIDIEDIARGLSYLGCYRGQTSHFYSLAQHSLLVASLVPPQHRLAALLHEATSAYLGETGPALRALWPALASIERGLDAAIREKFGLPSADCPALQRAHLIALATEQRDLLPQRAENRLSRGRSAPIPRRIDFLAPEEARFQFSEVFAEVSALKTPAVAVGRHDMARRSLPDVGRTQAVGLAGRGRTESGTARSRRM